MDGNKLCESIKKISGDEVILMFSRGKDSIASYYQLKKYFSKIHLVYKFRVPELKFVDESLDYFENKFGQKIIRIPHPAFYKQFNGLLFQDPNSAKFIQYKFYNGFHIIFYILLKHLDQSCYVVKVLLNQILLHHFA